MKLTNNQFEPNTVITFYMHQCNCIWASRRYHIIWFIMILKAPVHKWPIWYGPYFKSHMLCTFWSYHTPEKRWGCTTEHVCKWEFSIRHFWLTGSLWRRQTYLVLTEPDSCKHLATPVKGNLVNVQEIFKNSWNCSKLS